MIYSIVQIGKKYVYEDFFPAKWPDIDIKNIQSGNVTRLIFKLPILFNSNQS